LFSETLPEEHK